MSSAPPADGILMLAESQRMALINLLADEDPSVYEAVRGKILSFGPEAAEWLRPYALSNDPVLRRRARAIIRHFLQRTASDRFLSFCQGQADNLDLEEGIWRLAQTQYPEINVHGYIAVLDDYA